jgi:hypothetical protein
MTVKSDLFVIAGSARKREGRLAKIDPGGEESPLPCQFLYDIC